MAKRRTSVARLVVKLDEQRSLVMKESGDWLTGTIYHAEAGSVSVPLDMFLAGQRNEALSLVSRSKRIVSYGNVAAVIDAIFTNADAFKKALQE